MTGKDILIRQVRALAPGGPRVMTTEWQLSRSRGMAIARIGSFEEALLVATPLAAAASGAVYVQPLGGKAAPYEPHAPIAAEPSHSVVE